MTDPGYMTASTKVMKTIAVVGLLASFFIILSLFPTTTSIYDVTRAEAQIPQANDNNSTLNFSLSELFSNVEDSVVQVTAVNEMGIYEWGSGFIFDNNSHIIASSTTVRENNENLRVTFSDGTVYRAELIASDPFSDIAVLTVPQVPEDKIKPLPIGNSTELKVGEQVATIGSPFGLSGLLTFGVVAKLGVLYPVESPVEGATYSIPDTIVADLSVNPGNAGGPLFNMKGEVIGITIGQFPQTSISFAVPSNTINKVAPSLIETGSFAYPWLGISGVDITPEIADAIGLQEPRGFLITDIEPIGPAAEAGIRGASSNQSTINIGGSEIAVGGDVIIAIDGRPVTKIDDILGYILREKSVGDNLELSIFRDGQIQNIDITLEPRPSITLPESPLGPQLEAPGQEDNETTTEQDDIGGSFFGEQPQPPLTP